MAHGLNSVLKRGPVGCKSEGKTGIGSRRIFAPHFKLQVLDSYRNDADCKGNQRATARKYGIHRRQIQKWLQVENNLRNSVGKGKTSENLANPEARKCGMELALRSAGHRQRDDLSNDAYSQSAGGSEARVPALSPIAYTDVPWLSKTPPTPLGPAPLDYTTHSRSHVSPSAASPLLASPDPATPMDLSLKRPAPIASSEPRAPVRYPSAPLVPLRCISPPVTFAPQIKNDPDVWDLSTKGFKREYEDSYEQHSPVSINTTHKPIKLFKPYLDDLHDSSINEEIKVESPELLPACCSGCMPNPINEFYNNNHIHITEYYTLHELQPKSSIDYYYPINKSYMYQGTDCESPRCCTVYEDMGMIQTGPSLKQRQSYSLDFKLSAIECYYQDSICKGNQRAVANKYNIHRRQVQKWLKQEEELRQRNEAAKQMHIVR